MEDSGCTDGEDIKPKLEPFSDTSMDSAAPAAAEEEDTVPLSGSPFFTMIMTRTQVQKPFQMSIPKNFQRRLSEARVAAVLLHGGRSWPMKYCGDGAYKRLDMGWKDFAVGNRLRVGDACVFELMDDKDGLVFQVQVLRGDLPEEATSKGRTFDEPIVVPD